MHEFVVLGLGTDARIYGYVATSSPEAIEVAMPYILTCVENSERDPWLFLLEFLLEGALEVLFGLIEFF